MTGQELGRIVICDDEGETGRSWQEALEALPAVEERFRVDPLDPSALQETIYELERRQRGMRPGEEQVDPLGSGIDDADIVIVDFDLLTLHKEGASINETGERIAYLARAYSDCGYIVALNQFNKGDRTVFDLTLRGHPNSYADLNISSRQIANPGLWSDERAGFRPWHWPCLTKINESFRRRKSFVEENLDEPVLAMLGLDRDIVMPHFTRDQLQFISNDRDPTRSTFRDVVKNSRIGLRGKDDQTRDSFVAGIAAARIGKWLERVVLPGQNILIDLPHLGARFPSLVAGGSSQLSDWQALTSVCEAPALDEKLEANNSFNHELWFSRPAFIWPDLQRMETIREVADPFVERLDQFGFAEDVSRFFEHNQLRSFAAEVDSPWLTRYVVDPEGLPADSVYITSDFAVTEDKVSYQPGVQFSM